MSENIKPTLAAAVADFTARGMCFFCTRQKATPGPWPYEGLLIPICGRCFRWDARRKDPVIRRGVGGEWPSLKPRRSTARDRVYFIQASGGEIKIGWAQSPQERLRQLQPGNPRRLVLLGTIPGGPAKERELHSTFRRLRLLGEWFSPGADLLAFIQLHCGERP